MTEKTVTPRPAPLGLRASFGFGDRLGSATPGHIRACRKAGLLPVFAQQSIRELSRTGRTAREVMTAACTAVVAEGWNDPWGADADHLKTREDVRQMAAEGFTFFTIDPSAHVNNDADTLEGNALQAALEAVVASGAYESAAQIEHLYLGRKHELPEVGRMGFEDREPLYRAVVKYGRAIAYAEQMAGWILEGARPGSREIEISVDETDSPTSALEHLFIALDLKRRGVDVVSLAPRFVGDFEKGIDYKGELATFEEALRRHVAVARGIGPYKISVHSGSDKFRIYPALGRLCGELLHVKTAGTSYLEALRVVARRDPALFLELLTFALDRYDTDRASYHVSADRRRLKDPSPMDPAAREAHYLDADDGRQVLHVTFGSVLTEGRTAAGRPFKEALTEVLTGNRELHTEFLAAHLGKHLEALRAG